jgi:SAM-dependent methyltransferase
MAYDFARYLAAKESVEDRALNGYVRAALAQDLTPGPLDALEVGAGAGAMIARLAGREVLGSRYTAVDADPANTAAIGRRFAEDALPVELELVTADVYAFAGQMRGRRQWDLLVAHAFLDLVDAPRLLPQLFALLRPGGCFYFPINFDGLTAFQPLIDPAFDEEVIAAYHRTMDERRHEGRPTGGSRAGRELLTQIPAAGGEIIAAGASDWLVWPRDGAYPADEAYFLHYMLHFFESSLTGRPELDAARLQAWLARRHAQIDAGELVLIVHQIDVCGRVPAR